MHPTIWKLGYGAGHLLNDVCASIWFSYTLLVYQRVFLFPNDLVGIVVLVGQVADGLGTIFVGFMADREMTCCLRKYGKRKVWHLIGTALTVCTFPLMFSPCLGCEDSSKIIQLFYYLTMVVIFQLGWAAVQISHLSLIPVLAKTPKSRTDLNAIRYAFTVSGNIFVYLVALVVLFGSGKDNETAKKGHSHLGTSRSTIGPEDAAGFQVIVGSTMVVGILAVVLFHAITSEPVESPQEPCKTAVVEYQGKNDTLRAWLTSTDFWILCFMYMCTRLYVNLSMSYIALYMNDYMTSSKTKVTAIPLVLYTGGLLGSVCLKKFHLLLGKRWSLAVGALLGCTAAGAVYLGSGRLYADYLVFAAVTLLGVAGSLLLVTTLALTSDVIADSARAAFVYGALSFGDKLSGGLVIEGIQRFILCSKVTSGCSDVYRYILVISCGVTSLIVLIMTLVYGSPSLWKQHRKNGGTLSTSGNSILGGITSHPRNTMSAKVENEGSMATDEPDILTSTAFDSSLTSPHCSEEPSIGHPFPYLFNESLREIRDPLYRSIMDLQAGESAARPRPPLTLGNIRRASFAGRVVNNEVPRPPLARRFSVAGREGYRPKWTTCEGNSLFTVEEEHISSDAPDFLSISSRASSHKASAAAIERRRSSSIPTGVLDSGPLPASAL